MFFFILRKVKRQLKCKKKKRLCSLWRRYFEWVNMLKMVCEVFYWKFLIERCSMAGVDSDRIKAVLENINIIQWVRETTYSKYLNQIWKIGTNKTKTKKWKVSGIRKGPIGDQAKTVTDWQECSEPSHCIY